MSRACPGVSYPLGARADGVGTNFAVYSTNATAIDLCLIDDGGAEERVPLEARTGPVWHGHLPGIGPGQRYGYRASGPWAPADGHLFNPAKFLIDPYALAIDGPARALPQLGAARAGSAPLEPCPIDTLGAVPASVVVDTAFDWEDDHPPGTGWDQTIVYELHVRGFTAAHPDVRPDLRGTYAGLASDAATGYLRSLGVTAVELLPVHHVADEAHLVARGRSNYWGYSSIGFLAPHAGYAAGGSRGEQVNEFKGMVKALHRAGIEVILDVVYNHTAEGGPDGPVLAFRGLDNAAYYRLDPADRGRYRDVTGTGNTLDVTNPDVLRLVMDSLRYFAQDMRVDGFRFDLATALAREEDGFERGSAFLDAVRQDPVLSRVKLIAEPWDVGPGGYQVGGFPAGWAEWNGVYRDQVRDFWRGHGGGVADLATRIGGSSDLYGRGGRGTWASVNFVTCHDGFTLTDLVSYDRKHNYANGEDNRDGTDDNRSWNCGAEGDTADPAIAALRARQRRNFLATVLLSQGTPMLLAGDELGRTQGGNNNAYCVDDATVWVDWARSDEELAAFVRRLIALRGAHPVLRRRQFLTGHARRSRLPDLWWFRTDGRQMAGRDWRLPEHQTLGAFLNGDEIGDAAPDGSEVSDDSFLVLVNGGAERRLFRLPARRFGARWRFELSTAEPATPPGERSHPARSHVPVPAHSLLVLSRPPLGQTVPRDGG